MQTVETMSRTEKREAREMLRSAIEEINSDLESKRQELADAIAAVVELRNEIEALMEGKAWRREALKALKA